MNRRGVLFFSAVALMVMAAFTACGNDNPGDSGDPDKPDKPGGGNGTAGNPYKVANVSDLKRVGAGETAQGGKWMLDSHYIQVADINISSEADWKSIGPATSAGFSGVYDGAGYAITNLNIPGPRSYAGLFSKVVDGTIKNVRLSNVKITANVSVGGLVAELNGGTISHCSVSNIEIKAAATGMDPTHAGGLLGYNVSASGTVSNCMATNGVVENFFSSGGLVGANNGKVVNCYSTVTVSGKSQHGGVAGTNILSGLVQYCYATGDITSEEYDAGGIVGSNSGKVHNCVALNKTVKKNKTGTSYIARITTGSGALTEPLLGNFARANMTLTAGAVAVNTSTGTQTGIHGASVQPADYNGANSATWWNATAKFPASEWEFAANRLPHLKGFSGLTQNPTVNN
jgi:hypothetical protein